MLGYTRPGITNLGRLHLTEDLKVLHENENHPHVSGNKWWKLKYNLEEAKNKGYDIVLTFGGAYSNHIYATAAAAKEYGLKSIGVIRGEEVRNNTLEFAKSCGMELRFVSREEYRKANDVYKTGANYPEGRADFVVSDTLRSLGRDRCYIIPEGGTNELALKGVSEWAKKILEMGFDDVYVPVGTGGTIAGLIKGFEGQRNIIGVSVLKNDGFLEKDVRSLLSSSEVNDPGNWTILNQYHFGGYAKSNSELISFCEQMKGDHSITIEPVYTGKLFYAVFDQLKTNPELRKRKSLVIHTGGLQYLR